MKLLQKLNSVARHPAVLLLIRVCVGGVFIAFGVVKAIEPHADFFSVIGGYQVLPSALIPLFGTVLIVAEVIVGVMFVLGLYMRYTTYAVLTLLFMFVAAISQTMLRGIPLTNCGCSGTLINLGETAGQVLFRDGVLILGVLWVWHVDSRALTLDRWFDKTKTPAPEHNS